MPLSSVPQPALAEPHHLGCRDACPAMEDACSSPQCGATRSGNHNMLVDRFLGSRCSGTARESHINRPTPLHCTLSAVHFPQSVAPPTRPLRSVTPIPASHKPSSLAAACSPHSRLGHDHTPAAVCVDAASEACTSMWVHGSGLVHPITGCPECAALGSPALLQSRFSRPRLPGPAMPTSAPVAVQSPTPGPAVLPLTLRSAAAKLCSCGP